ncbi:uncharacterized protein A4U43_C01F35350 [Asparagus officinalis]|uniref:Pentacotripeptide-repeat region of PRORP domain-containing protein n=1 Tax=Asparagus officinalis TaxID=4686 RepID=A0A5P1FVD9_ASPOF|nr:uncharacterized protein A4U43_C01F35350 [Asparagus officinalis]
MNLIRSHLLPSSKPSHIQILINFFSSKPRNLHSNPNTLTLNQNLSALVRQGNFGEARNLFDEMPERNLITYSTMINLYIKNGDLLKAESLYTQLPKSNVVVDSVMIDGLSKAGRIDDAQRLFDSMSSRNVFSWTSLLSGYCRIGEISKAREIFDRMPDKNVYSWNTMVLGYARNGQLGEALEMFDRMPERNVVSWTAMVRVLAESGRIDEAREMFDRMPHRNLYSWNVMISGYLGAEKPKEAVELFESMTERNVVSWTTMVTGLARNGSIERARDIFDRMPRKDVASWNAMITVYGEKGLMVDARELFDSMKERNVVTWNAMIDSYAKNGFQNEAVELLILMLRSPAKPNETTLTSVLVALENALEIMVIHGLAKSLGFDSDTSLTNALVTMYSRSGDLSSARLAFEDLEAKDIVSWTSMILAYSYHGQGHHALQTFARMLRRGAVPDSTTFIGVLSACSHCGLVEKGQRFFESMDRAYKLKPRAEHYSCLVDLLGKAGRFDEANAVVSRMAPEDRDGGVLVALLGACRAHQPAHNEISLASEIGEELMRREEAGSGVYALLANMYASRGEWGEAARVRRRMRERRVEKVAGRWRG